MNNLEILAKHWIHPGGTQGIHRVVHPFAELTIGVIVCKDTVTGKQKAYIGIGSGHNEKADTADIMRRGGRLRGSELLEIAGLLQDEAE